MRYYTDPKVNDRSKGLLPFRCWQIYDEMVDAVKKRDTTRYVCAAGILSHYVGDACQALHISYMFNGDPAKMEKVTVTKKGVSKEIELPVAHGVHSAYEDSLVNFHSPEIMAALKKTFQGKTHHGQPLNRDGGFGAAKAVLDLMQATFKAIKPIDIVNAYVPIKKLKPREIADHLWAQFGKATTSVMADGARTLAMLWDSAWKEGGGTAKMAARRPIRQAAFKKLYTKPKFLESFNLAEIGKVLKGKPLAVSKPTAVPKNGTSNEKVRNIRTAAAKPASGNEEVMGKRKTA
jgi:hypothetical protein